MEGHLLLSGSPKVVLKRRPSPYTVLSCTGPLLSIIVYHCFNLMIIHHMIIYVLPGFNFIWALFANFAVSWFIDHIIGAINLRDFFVLFSDMSPQPFKSLKSFFTYFASVGFNSFFSSFRVSFCHLYANEKI